jgi:hypothetical protein
MAFLSLRVQNGRTRFAEGDEMIRSTRCLSGAILAGISLLIPITPFAQDKAHTKQDSAAAAPSNPANPGPEHAALLKRAGEYTRIVKFIGQPGAAGEPSSGTAKLSVMLGGRFLLEESTDVVFGRTVDGLRLYGYNNATRQYEMARTYTMSTAITLMTGTSKDGGQTINFTTTPDPGGPGKMPLHAQFRSINEDQFVVTFSTVKPDGQETPFQETTYARKK